MRARSLVVELALLLAVCFTAILPGTAGAQSFAVRDVRVFDGERLHPRLTVVVRDGAIESMRPGTVVPSRFEVIDGQGQTLLPGLVDSHMHAREDALVQTLVFGVTTVLDMFTDPAWAAARRAEQEERRAGGRSDLLSAGLVINARWVAWGVWRALKSVSMHPVEESSECARGGACDRVPGRADTGIVKGLDLTSTEPRAPQGHEEELNV